MSAHNRNDTAQENGVRMFALEKAINLAAGTRNADTIVKDAQVFLTFLKPEPAPRSSLVVPGRSN